MFLYSFSSCSILSCGCFVERTIVFCLWNVETCLKFRKKLCAILAICSDLQWCHRGHSLGLEKSLICVVVSLQTNFEPKNSLMVRSLYFWVCIDPSDCFAASFMHPPPKYVPESLRFRVCATARCLSVILSVFLAVAMARYCSSVDSQFVPTEIQLRVMY